MTAILLTTSTSGKGHRPSRRARAGAGLSPGVACATVPAMTFLTRLPAEPRTIDEPLAYWADKNPDGEAVTYGQRTWSWREWNERVRRAAGGLRGLGVRRGDVVAFLDKNHPACVEITLAAGSIGAAHAIVNWRSAGDEVDYAVNDSGAKVLFVGVELMPTIEKIRDRLVNVEKIVTVTPDGADGDEYEAWLAASEPLDRPDETAVDDVCLVMYSSGTTGRPKGVMLTHSNMVRHTDNAHEGWGFEEATSRSWRCRCSTWAARRTSSSRSSTACRAS